MEEVSVVSAVQSKGDDDERLDLPPGFRFHPTDEEIITHYLSQKVLNCHFSSKAFAQVDLNKCEPWDLPSKAKMGEKEWYFFCRRDRKYPTGMRTNRATEAGYWKATGKDKEIYNKLGGRGSVVIGMKKTLVFYIGRAPKGEKTNWIMHEYRLLQPNFSHDCTSSSLPKAGKDDWVVSRVFDKSSTTTDIKKISTNPTSAGTTQWNMNSSFMDEYDDEMKPPCLMRRLDGNISHISSISTACMEDHRKNHMQNNLHGNYYSGFGNQLSDQNSILYTHISLPNPPPSLGYMQQAMLLGGVASPHEAYHSMVSVHDRKPISSTSTTDDINSREAASVVSNHHHHEMGSNNRVCYQDLEGPSSSASPPRLHFDSLWSY